MAERTLLSALTTILIAALSFPKLGSVRDDLTTGDKQLGFCADQREKSRLLPVIGMGCFPTSDRSLQVAYRAEFSAMT